MRQRTALLACYFEEGASFTGGSIMLRARNCCNNSNLEIILTAICRISRAATAQQHHINYTATVTTRLKVSYKISNKKATIIENYSYHFSFTLILLQLRSSVKSTAGIAPYGWVSTTAEGYTITCSFMCGFHYRLYGECKFACRHFLVSLVDL